MIWIDSQTLYNPAVFHLFYCSFPTVDLSKHMLIRTGCKWLAAPAHLPAVAEAMLEKAGRIVHNACLFPLASSLSISWLGQALTWWRETSGDRPEPCRVQWYRAWVRDDDADSLLARHQHYHRWVGCFFSVCSAFCFDLYFWDCLQSVIYLLMVFIKNRKSCRHYTISNTNPFIAVQAQNQTIL